MKTVYKYTINYEEANTASFDIPDGARFLSLQVQQGKPVLYFEVESLNWQRKQDFLLVETGTTIPYGAKHIGTVMLRDGWYVLHVYWDENAGIIM